MIFGNKFSNIDNSIVTEKTKVIPERRRIVAKTKSALKKLFNENGFTDPFKIFKWYLAKTDSFLSGKGNVFVYTIEHQSGNINDVKRCNSLDKQLYTWVKNHKDEIIESIQNATDTEVDSIKLYQVLLKGVDIEVKYKL